MMNDASANEWLVEGGPQTPKSAAEPSNHDTPGMASDDVLMAPVDPYFDEDEEEINTLEQALKDNREALAAKQRKIEARSLDGLVFFAYSISQGGVQLV
eukprot:4750507-Amphidinium_carterae.1